MVLLSYFVYNLLFFHFLFFFFNDTATTEIYTLSLHDALPILVDFGRQSRPAGRVLGVGHHQDRKSTRLNSSHRCISYAVFCLKKKKNKNLWISYKKKQKKKKQKAKYNQKS